MLFIFSRHNGVETTCGVCVWHFLLSFFLSITLFFCFRFLFYPQIFALIVRKSCFLLWFLVVFGVLNFAFSGKASHFSLFIIFLFPHFKCGGRWKQVRRMAKEATCWETDVLLSNFSSVLHRSHYFLSIHYFNWFIVVWNCLFFSPSLFLFLSGRTTNFQLQIHNPENETAFASDEYCQFWFLSILIEKH